MSGEWEGMNGGYGQARRGGRVMWVPIVLALLFAGYRYLTAPKVVDAETGRVLRGALTDDQGSALGLQSYQQVLSGERVVGDGPEADMVGRVAKRLIAAVGDAGAGFDWRVSVVESPQANAFCLPGGRIVVFTGILPITKNEDGLAVVMGHEIAHATLRHGSQRMLQTQLAQTVLQGAQASVSMGEMSLEQRRMVLGALGAGAKLGVLLPFSREHESEADERGLSYAARAGFDPREAVGFWERMAAAGGGGPPEFASTHPSHGTRIEKLRELMPRALEEYERARKR
jgi:metalloendopeptidase OMA1, mitochondrial